MCVRLCELPQLATQARSAFQEDPGFVGLELVAAIKHRKTGQALELLRRPVRSSIFSSNYDFGGDCVPLLHLALR